MNDLVSVIMPSYNTADRISDSIKSVLAQSYKNLELIIVDDCSKDNTDEVVASFADERIRYYKNDKNSGAAVSRNKALKEAKGRWIAFLDSDDVWLPEKLQKQIDFMEKNGYSFSYTDYMATDYNGNILPYVFTAPHKVGKLLIYCYCWFSTITVMYDADVVGLLQIEDLKKNNDYAMWLEASKHTEFYRLPEALSVYCRRNNSISSGSKFKLIKHHYILFRKQLKKSKPVAFLLTANNLFFGIIKKIVFKKKMENTCNVTL